MILVTALGFYSMFGSLESLLNLKQKLEMVTAISVEVFPGVLQTEQKYIGKWREVIEAEINSGRVKLIADSSSRFRSFRDNVQNLQHSDGREESMGQKTTDDKVQSQHDCLVV